MIKKVLFIGDCYRRDQERNVEVIFGLISPLLLSGDVTCQIFKNHLENQNDQIYLDSLDGNFTSIFETMNLIDTAIIGFEMSLTDLKYFNKMNIPWINFEIHPIRFLDDLYFNITSSFTFNFLPLALSYHEIKLYANMVKLKYKIQQNPNHNSILIIGQTPIDKSIYFDKQFKSLKDYEKTLKSITNNFDSVYYKPHPSLSDPYINEWVIKEFKASLIHATSYYELLSTNMFSTVCGISSSSLYEADYFDKSVIFLESRKKLFNLPISMESFLNNSLSWSKEFLGESITYKKNIVFLPNSLRDMYEYWSFQTPISHLSYKLNQVESELKKTEDHSYHLEQTTNNQIIQLQFDINTMANKSVQAEQNADEAKIKAEAVEQSANEAKARASQAEQNAHESKIKAEAAEQSANEAYAKASQAEQNANESKIKAEVAEQNANESKIKAEVAEQNAQNGWQHYHMIENSNSWKITKPLRLLGKFSRWFVSGSYHWLTFSPTSRPRRVVKRKILEIKNFINTKPQLKSKIMKILDHFPKLKSRLKRIGQQHPVILATTSIEFINERREVNGESINLSPQAKKIYNDLKIAIKHQQQERH